MKGSVSRSILLLVVSFILITNLQAGIGAGVSSEGVLPVELVSFNAKTIDQTVILLWETATEVDNYGFQVERKKAKVKRQIDAEWETLGFVEGAGNSNSPKEYRFEDESPVNGSVQYRLKQIDTDGKFEYSDVVELDINILPKEFSLAQNYPNPFNPSTVIAYSIPEKGHVILGVYDALGRLVSRLVNKNQETGSYNVKFDNKNRIGSGVYFYRIEVTSKNGSSNYISTKKMLLLK